MSKMIVEGFELSRQQKNLWSLQQEEAGAAYRAQCAVLLEGALDKEALASALESVVRRHDVLRMTFYRAAGMAFPLQVIADECGPSLSTSDLRGRGRQEQEAEVDALFAKVRRSPIDLRQNPLREIHLATLSPQRHVVVISLPAMCADAQTLTNLVEEIRRAYAARALGEEAEGEEVQYVQFSEWQRELLEEGGGEEAKSFWQSQDFSAGLAVKFAFERADAGQNAFEPASVSEVIGAESAARIKAVARKYDSSPAIFLLACWQALVWRLTDCTDVVVGSLLGKRAYEELEGALGLFGEALPVRGRVQESLSFGALVRQLDRTAREVERHQEFFGRQETPAGGEGLMAPTSFPVCFEYEQGYAGGRAAGVSFSIQRRYVCSNRFKVKLSCLEQGGALKLELHYDAGALDAADAERLVGRVKTLAESALETPAAGLGELEILSAAEREQLLSAFSETRTDYPNDLCIHQLFERQAELTPDAVAVCFEEQSLTYRELNERANQLAHHLRRGGFGPEARAGVLLERSVEMVVALLGVMKAGGAYVPLDAGLPPERIAFLLGDARAQVLLTQRALKRNVAPEGVRLLCLDADWEAVARESRLNVAAGAAPDNALYVIYTSGSTGDPKGVVVEHRQMLNYLQAVRDRLELPGGASYALVSTVGADLGHTVLYPSLCTGGRLHVISTERASDPRALGEYFARHAVDCLKIVPSHLSALLQPGGGESVLPRRRLVLGGEASHWPLIEKVRGAAPGCRIDNHYGPTETTVGVLTYRVGEGRGDAASGTVPLGRPLANTQVYILDEKLRPAPVGQAGELYVGGAGLSRGYLNRPELTAERFVPHPFGTQAGARLYRTGDRARHLPDGNVEFLGRVDGQFKVRGFRIEPGEIEAALRRHPGVHDAVVIAREEAGDKKLLAYFVPTRECGPTIEGRPRHLLPNGMSVVYQSKKEADHLYEEIFRGRGYFRHGITLRDGDCVFDVGANVGLFSLYVSQHYPNASVFAFEPIAPVFDALRLNAQLYGPNVKAFGCGLSAEERIEAFTFYPQHSMLSTASDYADLGEEVEILKRHMLAQPPPAGAARPDGLAAQAADWLATQLESETQACRLRRLSDVMREQGVGRIDLLKVDVQRAELDVLKGLDEDDWAKVEQVVMEVHDGLRGEGRVEEITALLEGHGFRTLVEQDEILKGTDRYNLYARRGELGVEGEARADAPAEVADLGRGTLTGGELRRHLKSRLPDYMIPSEFIALEELPLTANGKIDRGALPAPDQVKSDNGEDYTAPLTPVQELLATIWAEVLGGKPVGVGDNFFELGGHSLLVILLVSRLREVFGVELPLRTVFEAPTVAALSERIEAARQEAQGLVVAPIVAVSREQALPLSFAQQRLWFMEKLQTGATLYNVAATRRLSGPLNVEALERSLSELARRHESLRTSFAEVEGEPVQVVAAPRPVSLTVTDLRGLAAAERKAEARRLAREEARRPFDLSAGPLVRAGLLRLADDEHALLLTLHHIIADGWSMSVLFRELSELYNAYSKGQPAPLAELEVQYADYAVWQRGWLSGEVLEQQLNFWRRQLAGAPPVLELPTDRPRPAVRSHRGAMRMMALSEGAARALKGLCRQQEVTLFMLLLAAFQVLLHRYSGQDKVSVGSPIAGRSRRETQGLIGFFVNTLVMCTDLAGNPSFLGLLRRVREACLDAYAHQDVPFEKLVEVLQPERAAGTSPLFQVWFVLQNGPAASLDLENISLSPMVSSIETAQFDLSMVMIEGEERIAGVLIYDTDLFDADTVSEILKDYETLLEQVAANPGQRILEIPLHMEGPEASAVGPLAPQGFGDMGEQFAF